jgi:RNA polymerase sigma-70 factor (ECF subfamily)
MKIEPVAPSTARPLSRDPESGVDNDDLVCSKQYTRTSEWTHWAALVQQIENGCARAESDLCHSLLGTLRRYFLRQRRSEDAEDLAHEALLTVLQAIRNKQLREPERLMGFVRVVANRTLYAAFRSAERQCRMASEELTEAMIDQTSNPESAALTYERATMIREGLLALSELDRNILTRFYLHLQSPETICEELDLTETQFRLKKSRAKARLGKVSQRIRGRRQLTLRASARATIIPFPQD